MLTYSDYVLTTITSCEWNWKWNTCKIDQLYIRLRLSEPRMTREAIGDLFKQGLIEIVDTKDIRNTTGTIIWAHFRKKWMTKSWSKDETTILGKITRWQKRFSSQKKHQRLIVSALKNHGTRKLGIIHRRMAVSGTAVCLNNLLSKKVNFEEQTVKSLKSKLKTLYWDFLYQHYNENNFCAWKEFYVSVETATQKRNSRKLGDWNSLGMDH